MQDKSVAIEGTPGASSDAFQLAYDYYSPLRQGSDVEPGLICDLIEQLRVAHVRVRELDRLINTPQTKDFLDAVKTEAAHQQLRWPAEQDAGKSDADWFWLIGYLAGKAIRPNQESEKRLHHIITTAAVCLNWHRHATGEMTAMRPGIEPPEVAQCGYAKRSGGAEANGAL
jgi:hypothetical protein